MTTESFINPYDSLTEDRQHRTSLVLDRMVWVHLHAIHGRKGTLQTTINILMSKLLAKLDEAGIKDYDPDTYEKAVAECTIQLGGVSNGKPTTKRSKASVAHS